MLIVSLLVAIMAILDDINTFSSRVINQITMRHAGFVNTKLKLDSKYHASKYNQ